MLLILSLMSVYAAPAQTELQFQDLGYIMKLSVLQEASWSLKVQSRFSRCYYSWVADQCQGSKEIV